MRRKRPSSNTGNPNRVPRRRRDADLPAVPVFQTDSLPAATPQSTETEDDPADEAIKRMIEASYT